MRPSMRQCRETWTDSTSDAALIPLEEQCKELVSIWKSFQVLFPEAKDSNVTVVGAGTIPTVDGLLRAVQKAEADWQDKRKSSFGKAKGRFLAFLDTMNDHSYLFSFIPQGDKYTSLITGVVSSVVKVRPTRTSTA